MAQAKEFSMFSLLMLNKPLRTVMLLLALNSGHASANSAFDTFQLHGFVNQGYFISSNNNVFGKSSSNNGSLGLTEVGINASIRPFSQLGFAIQGIYRKAGALNDEAQIDFALLDWTFHNTGNTQAGLRLGRIKNPIGFYNETRDMPFTRPSILLPHGIYFERLRNLYLSADGAQLYFNQSTSIGDFNLKISAGKPLDDIKELEVAFFSFDAPGTLKPKDAYLTKLEYESSSGATRLALSYVDLNLQYDKSTHDVFNDGDISINLFILSAQQNIDKFTLTGEYLWQESSVSNFGVFMPDSKPISESYFIQGDYRLPHNLQISLRYDVSYLNKDDKDGDMYSALTGRPKHAVYIKDTMIGLRWMPSYQWMVRAEYHLVDGTSVLSHADNPDANTSNKNWDLFALQLSYRF